MAETKKDKQFFSIGRIFFLLIVIPLSLMAFLIANGIFKVGDTARERATTVLDLKSQEEIKIRAINTAEEVANFLRERENDVLVASILPGTEAAYKAFVDQKKRNLWVKDRDGRIQKVAAPLYSEMSLIDRSGNEIVRIANGAVRDPDDLVAGPVNQGHLRVERRGNLLNSPVSVLHPEIPLLLIHKGLVGGLRARKDGGDEDVILPLPEEIGHFLRRVDRPDFDLFLGFQVQNGGCALSRGISNLEDAVGNQESHERQGNDDKQEENPSDGEELLIFLSLCHYLFPLFFWIFSERILLQDHRRVGVRIENDKTDNQSVNNAGFRHGHADEHGRHDFALYAGVAADRHTGAVGGIADARAGTDRTEADTDTGCQHGADGKEHLVIAVSGGKSLRREDHGGGHQKGEQC